MATYLLRFERYVQLAAYEEVEADSVDAAIEAASEMDLGDAYWEEEYETLTTPRLYNIKDEAEQELVCATIPYPTNDWWSECLTEQWGNDPGGAPGQDELDRVCRQTGEVWTKLAPEFTGAGKAELERGRLETTTAPISKSSTRRSRL